MAWQATWRAPQKEPPSPELLLERALKQRHPALAFVNSAGTSRAAARHEKRRVRRVACSTGVGGELNIIPGQGGGLSRMRYFLYVFISVHTCIAYVWRVALQAGDPPARWRGRVGTAGGSTSPVRPQQHAAPMASSAPLCHPHVLRQAVQHCPSSAYERSVIDAAPITGRSFSASRLRQPP